MFEDIDLIQQVRRFDLLYDKRNALFKDIKAKSKAWNTIAASISDPLDVPATADQCQSRWNVLRTKFNVIKKSLDHPVTGSDASTTVGMWPLFNEMKFINQHIRPRRPRGNVGKRIKPELAESSSSNSAWDYVSTSLNQQCNTEVVVDSGLEATQTERKDAETEDMTTTQDSNLKRKRTLSASDDFEKQMQLALAKIGFSSVVQQLPSSLQKTSDDIFGESVAAELKSINNKLTKIKLKSKIMFLLQEALEEQEENL